MTSRLLYGTKYLDFSGSGVLGPNVFADAPLVTDPLISRKKHRRNLAFLFPKTFRHKIERVVLRQRAWCVPVVAVETGDSPSESWFSGLRRASRCAVAVTRLRIFSPPPPLPLPLRPGPYLKAKKSPEAKTPEAGVRVFQMGRGVS